MSEEQKYNVIYAGAIKQGFDEYQVKANFVSKMNIPKDKVGKLFAGNRVVLKKYQSKLNAERWQKKLLDMGAETAIIPFVEASQRNRSQLDDKRTASKTNLPSNKNQKDDNIKSSQTEYDEEMQANIRRAQALIAAQQLESQMSGRKESNPIKKLIVFSVVLSALLMALYFYVGSMF